MKLGGILGGGTFIPGGGLEKSGIFSNIFFFEYSRLSAVSTAMPDVLGLPRFVTL